MIYSLSIFLIFLGSVFFTSQKFVDTETAVKFYYTIIVVLAGIVILMLKHCNLRSEAQKLTTILTLKGLFIIGVLQAIYGILQYTGLCTSNHRFFAITGSFENPSGFVAILSLVLPIGVYWCLKSKGWEQKLVFIAIGSTLFSIVLSGSRTGILSAVISILIVFAIEFQLFSKLKNLKYSIGIVFIVIIILLFSVFLLYQLRKDSADGRLLIWEVSFEMFKDKPLGYGYNGFQANYMNYQAKYFKGNPQSIYTQLADNVKHPFNEFVKIAINYGAVGLVFYLLMLTVIFWKAIKIQASIRGMLLGVFATFIVLTSFSYPLQYAPVWFLLAYFTLVSFSNSAPNKRLSLLTIVSITVVCITGIFFLIQRLSKEIEWKTIAVKSMQGFTEEMLPQYQMLYPHLKKNAFFLYNYGAEVYVAKDYKKSITILEECQKQLSDYDLQMLLADNYYQIGDTDKAIQSYKHAENMIPCRFLPLYYQFEIYKEVGRVEESLKIAQKIIAKDVKVNSNTVEIIIKEANNFLFEKEANS